MLAGVNLLRLSKFRVYFIHACVNTVTQYCVMGGKLELHSLWLCTLIQFVLYALKYIFLMMAQTERKHVEKNVMWGARYNVAKCFVIILYYDQQMHHYFINYYTPPVICTMANKCTVISQIILLLLHISTLPCHPKGACNQYLANLHKYFKCSCW